MAENFGIKISSVDIKGKRGYDLKVTDPEVTLQDYINALENAFNNLFLYRDRNQVTTCEGCRHCCNERIPLTSVDAWQLMAHFKKSGMASPPETITEFIARYCYVTVDGPSVDITLRFKDDYCIFLNQSSKCQHYGSRTLVCHTFFCCPATSWASRLREVIVNSGEDELVRLWLTEAAEKDLPLTVDEAYDEELDINDWLPNPYTGKKLYSEVKLRDLCPARLWSQLTK